MIICWSFFCFILFDADSIENSTQTTHLVVLFLNGISFMDPCKYTVILISMPSRRFKEVWKGATPPVWIIQQVNGWTGPRTAQSFGSRMGWGSRLCGTHDCIKEHFGKKNKKRLHFVSIYATSQRLCNIALLVRTRHCRLWIFTVWVCHVRKAKHTGEYEKSNIM